MKLIQGSNQRLRAVFYVIVLTISFVSFSGKSIVIHRTSAFENFMIDSFGPLQQSVSYVHNWASDIFSHYVANINASKKNIELQETIKKQQKKIYQLTEIEKENKRLKELLAFGEQSPYKEVLAQIVAWDASSDFKVIRINKGASDGVKLQSTVITADGLVGYVFRLTNNFADILTILDPNNRVDGIVQRIRAHGIIEGYSKDKCAMKYVTRTEPVILNDLVITSGLGNIYPKGLRIGYVSRIERESYGITQDIHIDPAVDFSRLEEVVVLVSDEDALKKKEWNALDSIESQEAN